MMNFEERIINVYANNGYTVTDLTVIEVHKSWAVFKVLGFGPYLEDFSMVITMDESCMEYERLIPLPM